MRACWGPTSSRLFGSRAFGQPRRKPSENNPLPNLRSPISPRDATNFRRLRLHREQGSSLADDSSQSRDRTRRRAALATTELAAIHLVRCQPSSCQSLTGSDGNGSEAECAAASSASASGARRVGLFELANLCNRNCCTFGLQFLVQTKNGIARKQRRNSGCAVGLHCAR